MAALKAGALVLRLARAVLTLAVGAGMQVGLARLTGWPLGRSSRHSWKG
jgi:hypothetical protein